MDNQPIPAEIIEQIENEYPKDMICGTNDSGLSARSGARFGYQLALSQMESNAVEFESLMEIASKLHRELKGIGSNLHDQYTVEILQEFELFTTSKEKK